jgi:AcrR family transcriptional regulator
MRTAERLFAEQGIDAVSLRQIGTAAGMRMAGTVAYHFGDKEGLIRAIIADRDGAIDARRRELLAEVERQGRTHDLRAVAEVGIRPSVEAIGRTGYYHRFVAQMIRHPSALADALDAGAFGAALRVLELQVAAGLDHLPPTVLEHRKRLGIHMLQGAVADLEAQARGPVDEFVIADLVDCMVALYSKRPSRRTLEACAVHDSAPKPSEDGNSRAAALGPVEHKRRPARGRRAS